VDATLKKLIIATWLCGKFLAYAHFLNIQGETLE